MKNYFISEEHNLILLSIKNGKTPFHEAMQEFHDSIITRNISTGMDLIADFRHSVFPGSELYANDFDYKVSIKYRFGNVIDIMPDDKEIIDKFRIFHTFKKRNTAYYSGLYLVKSLEEALEKLGLSDQLDCFKDVLADF